MAVMEEGATVVAVVSEVGTEEVVSEVGMEEVVMVEAAGEVASS